MESALFSQRDLHSQALMMSYKTVLGQIRDMFEFTIDCQGFVCTFQNSRFLVPYDILIWCQSNSKSETMYYANHDGIMTRDIVCDVEISNSIYTLREDSVLLGRIPWIVGMDLIETGIPSPSPEEIGFFLKGTKKVSCQFVGTPVRNIPLIKRINDEIILTVLFQTCGTFQMRLSDNVITIRFGKGCDAVYLNISTVLLSLGITQKELMMILAICLSPALPSNCASIFILYM